MFFGMILTGAASMAISAMLLSLGWIMNREVAIIQPMRLTYLKSIKGSSPCVHIVRFNYLK
jgi:hypothetical protein